MIPEMNWNKVKKANTVRHVDCQTFALPTDRQTNGPTDTASYRGTDTTRFWRYVDAPKSTLTHLKVVSIEILLAFSFYYLIASEYLSAQA